MKHSKNVRFRGRTKTSVIKKENKNPMTVKRSSGEIDNTYVQNKYDEMNLCRNRVALTARLNLKNKHTFSYRKNRFLLHPTKVQSTSSLQVLSTKVHSA